MNARIDAGRSQRKSLKMDRGVREKEVEGRQLKLRMTLAAGETAGLRQ
jgi:hypothetical protein